MTPIPYSKEYWEERADEARAIAHGMSFWHTKEAMLKVARSYDKLAREADSERHLAKRIAKQDNKIS